MEQVITTRPLSPLVPTLANSIRWHAEMKPGNGLFLPRTKQAQPTASVGPNTQECWLAEFIWSSTPPAHWMSPWASHVSVPSVVPKDVWFVLCTETPGGRGQAAGGGGHSF